MNIATISGVVVEDPKQKMTNGGSQILEFPMVTREEYLDRMGAPKVREIRHNAVCYGRMAQMFGERITKGTFVIVHGAIQNDYLDKPGQTKGFRSEIVARSIEIPAISAPA